MPKEKVSSYGIVASTPTDRERIFKVHDMVEKPAVEEAPSQLAVLGRYVIMPEIFYILEHTAPGRGGEIQLTDALKVLAKEQAMYAYDFMGRRYDVGDKLGYLEATCEYALRREDLREKFMDYLRTIVYNKNVCSLRAKAAAKATLFISPSILSVGGVIFLANSNSNRYLLGFAWLDSPLVL